MKKLDVNRFLGLPSDATQEQMEHRCEALLDWLESKSIPTDLQPWASAQHTLIQELYESMTPHEGEAGNEERAENLTLSIRGKAGGGGRRSFFPRLKANPLTLAATGMLLGLVIVGALWWSGAVFKGEEAAQSAPGQKNFNPREFLDSKQERIKELEGLIAANPQDADALFELGETYITGGDWERTIFWFTKLLEVDATNTHARLDVGTANMNLGRYKEAEAAFSKVLTTEPENAQAHFNMGFLFAFRSDASDLKTAVKHWQEVVRLAAGSDLAKVAQVHIDQFQAQAP